MKNFRRLLSLILSVVMLASLVSLAGCGENTPKKQKEGQVSGDDPYAGIEEYEGTTIKFATWIDHTKSEAARVFSSFEEKYGIKVELVSVNQKEYVTKISGLVASDAAPDIIVNNGKHPALYALAQPLGDVSTVNLKDDFWDKDIINTNTIGGNTYFVNSKYSPQNYMSLVTYNKKLFEDNGFKSPGEYYEEGNWTLATMEECATRIARLGSDYVGLSATPPNIAALFGTELIGFENEKYINKSDDETLQKAYKWAVSAKEKKIFTFEYMWWKFPKNLVGMEITTDWMCRGNSAYAQQGVDPDIVGYVPLPKLTADSEQLVRKDNRGYGICKGSKNAEAAGYFLRYFLEYENYDPDEIFSSKEAEETFKALRELDAKRSISIENGCMNVYYGEAADQPVYRKILSISSSQFAVSLKAFSSEIQTVVDSCNEIIDDLE